MLLSIVLVLRLLNVRSFLFSAEVYPWTDLVCLFCECTVLELHVYVHEFIVLK